VSSGEAAEPELDRCAGPGIDHQVDISPTQNRAQDTADSRVGTVRTSRSTPSVVTELSTTVAEEHLSSDDEGSSIWLLEGQVSLWQVGATLSD
jgi:hypothetical protein